MDGEGRLIPILRIVRLLQRVTHTCMAGRKDPWPHARRTWRIQLQVHQLIHVLQDQHIAIQLHNSVVFHEREGSQLAPAIVEARVITVIFLRGWKQIGDMLLGNTTNVKSSMSLRREGVSVERDERVGGVVFLERVVEREQAGQVLRISDQSRPHWMPYQRLCLVWSVVEATLSGVNHSAGVGVGSGEDAIVLVE